MEDDKPGSNGDITAALKACKAGEAGAMSALMKLVEDDLRRMASRQLKKESDGLILQTSAVVNEAYMRWSVGKMDFENRAHFFGAVARAMYEYLADEARRRNALKRGGGAQEARLDATDVPEPSISVSRGLDVSVEELYAALDELNELEAYKTAFAVISLRFLAGLTITETAKQLGISASTVKREFRLGRAWLFKRFVGQESASRA